MHNTLVAVFGLAASVAAQAGYGASTTTTIPAPTYSTGNATVAACDAAANACRTAPNANQAYCSSQYAACLGYNPYTADASSTSSSLLICNAAAIARGACTASAASVPSSTPTPTGNSTASCDAAVNACRTAPNANQAYCSAQYAQCLGYNPYTAGVSSSSSASDYWTTAVVTSYTTYCPAPTTVVANSKTYTGKLSMIRLTSRDCC